MVDCEVILKYCDGHQFCKITIKKRNEIKNLLFGDSGITCYSSLSQLGIHHLVKIWPDNILRAACQSAHFFGLFAAFCWDSTKKDQLLWLGKTARPFTLTSGNVGVQTGHKKFEHDEYKSHVIIVRLKRTGKRFLVRLGGLTPTCALTSRGEGSIGQYGSNGVNPYFCMSSMKSQ